MLSTTEHTPKTTRRIKNVNLRLPAGLHEQLDRKRRTDNVSLNSLIVAAVRNFLGEGGPATEDRIERLEQDVTAAVTAFAQAAEGLAEMQQRLSRLEALARRSGANL